MPILFLLLLPALEIYLFIKIGAEIGALAVIVWLVGAAFFGVNILRYLGATAMLDAARQMQAGAAPAETLADALVKAIAAVLLIIPGFATDFLAIVLLIPPIRQFLLRRWLRKFALKSSFGATGFGANDQNFGGNVYEHERAVNGESENSKGQKKGHVLEHNADKNNH